MHITKAGGTAEKKAIRPGRSCWMTIRLPISREARKPLTMRAAVLHFSIIIGGAPGSISGGIEQFPEHYS